MNIFLHRPRVLRDLKGQYLRRVPRRSRRLWVVLGAILLLAFGLRVTAYVENPKPVDGAGLAAGQAEMARNIIHRGRWFVVNTKAFDLIKQRQIEEQRLVDPADVDYVNVDRHPSYVHEVQQMPGLSVVLAGLWWVTGRETYSVLQWLQILIDTAMVLLIYWIAIRLTSNTFVAVLSALLYAIWIGAIIVAKRPVLDTWAGFFIIACVAAFIWARERPQNLWRLAPLGVVAGLAIYFRPFIGLLPIVLGLLATPGKSWRRRAIWMALPTGVALLLLAPWTVRNYYEFHRFIPTRTGLGQAVYEGVGGASSDEGSAETVHRKNPDTLYGSPEYDDFLVRAAVRQIIDNPSYYGGLILHRVRLLLPCLLVFLVWRRWKTAGVILVGAAMTTILPYLFIGDDTRFYLPAAFAYLILGAMATAVVMSHLRRFGRFKPSAPVVTVASDPSGVRAAR